MLLLGIDAGTSFIKLSVVDAESRRQLASVQLPDQEQQIISHRPGWAEQNPEEWWQSIKLGIKKLVSSDSVNPQRIGAIGISYQMHGLVLLDVKGKILRPAIIWSDSRAVVHGEEAASTIGREKCFHHMLNCPGNFTASKLVWVKENEPEIFERVDKVLLPGDFIAWKLTGQITTTPSALSEGILWDFQKQEIARPVLDHFDFPLEIFPSVKPVFAHHGTVTAGVAADLNLPADAVVSYKAGDQMNNTLTLGAVESGAVAASAGTSGVIFAVTDRAVADRSGSVNTFAHVNYTATDPVYGVLMCINGVGSMYRWLQQVTEAKSYTQMDEMIQSAGEEMNDLLIFPFGNGAERILQNRDPGACISGIDFNRHQQRHLYQTGLEGIAFAFRFGMEKLKNMEIQSAQKLHASATGLFKSDHFCQLFSDTLQLPLKVFEVSGSGGAALGAGIGIGVFKKIEEAFSHLAPKKIYSPKESNYLNTKFENWCRKLKLYQINSTK